MSLSYTITSNGTGGTYSMNIVNPSPSKCTVNIVEVDVIGVECLAPQIAMRITFVDGVSVKLAASHGDQFDPVRGIYLAYAKRLKKLLTEDGIEGIAGILPFFKYYEKQARRGAKMYMASEKAYYKKIADRKDADEAKRKRKERREKRLDC